jgi:hypothetical protein
MVPNPSSNSVDPEDPDLTWIPKLTYIKRKKRSAAFFTSMLKPVL